MRLATWNVNSIRTRLDRVLAWLERHSPDVVCFQETKATDDDFPRAPLEKSGYQVEVFGQKTYNGVAIISRLPLSNIRRGLPGEGPEDQKRLMAATVSGIEIVNVYVPNGSQVGSEKFVYKLDWLERLSRFLQETWNPRQEVLVCGDFNIAPEDRDVHDPDEWRGEVLFHPDEHAALRRLTDWGLEDVLRRHHPEAGLWSWWDYRAGAFRRDRGLRIDLILATASFTGRSEDVFIDKEERAGEKPSDHAPVVATFR